LNFLNSISIWWIELKPRIVLYTYIVRWFIFQIIFFNYQSVLILNPIILTYEAFACVLIVVWEETVAHSLQSLRLVELRAKFILYIYWILLPLVFPVLLLDLNHLRWRGCHLRSLVLLLNDLSLDINRCNFQFLTIKFRIIRVWFRKLAFYICLIFLRIGVFIFIWLLINLQPILIVTFIKHQSLFLCMLLLLLLINFFFFDLQLILTYIFNCSWALRRLQSLHFTVMLFGNIKICGLFLIIIIIDFILAFLN
jgi:hypothetical protein